MVLNVDVLRTVMCITEFSHAVVHLMRYTALNILVWGVLRSHTGAG